MDRSGVVALNVSSTLYYSSHGQLGIHFLLLLLLSMVLINYSTHLRCSLFFQVGQTYYFSGGHLKPKDPADNFNNCAAGYQLYLTPDSIVNPCEDDNTIPLMAWNFKTLRVRLLCSSFSTVSIIYIHHTLYMICHGL